MTNEERTDRILRLERAIASGILRVSLPDGSSTLYRTLDEMERALRRLKRDTTGGIKVNHADFRT